tara:strand:+ start:776 stop:3217 length:2442 start_codon:yes stop_codon:yes gene_type:complete
MEVHEKLSLSDANEAETRLKLIDRIVFDVLGWTHDDVTVETRVSEDGSTEYTDYILKTAFSTLIIEAKRVGSSELQLPNKRKELLSRKIVAGDTGKAIIQARDYGRKLGIPFAVVTNGSQWLVFPSSRTDSVSFAQSSAIIFPNLQSALSEDFADFFSLLSREAVIGGSLENELTGRREDQTLERRLNQFFDRPFTKVTRNSLYPIIENEVSVAFAEDIATSDPELLRKCYVDTAERLRFDRRINMHLSKRQNPLKTPPMKVMNRQGRSTFSETIERAKGRAKPLALLVLGSVGSGKTTFINHVRNVREASHFEPRKDAPYPHWIYIDCRKLSQSENSSDFFFSEMFQYLINDDFLQDYERCLKHAYKAEIASLKKGPLSLLAFDDLEVKREIASFIKKDYDEKKPFAAKVLGYAASNAPVFLVIDNVDQFEAQTVQTRIFSDAIAIAQRLGLNLILAMRDSTYVENKAKPIFDAFDFDPVQVEAPEVRAVLSRRFAVARELLQGKTSEFVAENGARMHLEDSSKIIDLIVESVLNTEVGNAIAVLSAGDIRLCLRMTRDFLRNGYSATGKAIGIYQKTGKYRLPPHEAMRAIMIGSQPVYAEQFSPVANPFDAKLSMTNAQLLRMFILSALVQRHSTRKTEAVTGEEIRAALLDVGFSPEITLKVLEDMCEARFIFTTSHSVASFEASYVPSRLGGHVARSLISDFTFLENTLMDTFIDDEEVWAELYRLTSEVYTQRSTMRKISLRAERVGKFYEYLNSRYSVLQAESERRAIGSEWTGNPFNDALPGFKINQARVLSSANRNYGTGTNGK